ncbi:MAG TPA: Rrf2 family transcriptional regulator [Anaerolineae bacterium]|nr:Rrf2 family transcriptional regulator [Anaerolineae bacterium]HQK13877.1 Rrf2 family transcriptional regulator [Anaerolineae bacterium]
MRLSTLGRYALRAMVDLALHQDQGPVQRKDIVARQEISSNYLAHLFVKLREAGLIESVKGPGGGYILARSAADISAGDVLRAVEEILEPVFCVDTNPEVYCPRMDACVTHLLWAQLGQRIIELLDSVTLAELCEQSRFLTAKEHIDNASTETGRGRFERRSKQLGGSIYINGAGI